MPGLGSGWALEPPRQVRPIPTFRRSPSGERDGHGHNYPLIEGVPTRHGGDSEAKPTVRTWGKGR